MKVRGLILVGGLFLTAQLFGRPLVVAHRGASAYAPENTIPAFKLAWKQGADAIEADFHQTLDGEIVCIHDDNTRSISGQFFDVAASDLKTLQSIDLQRMHGDQYPSLRLASIAEVLALVPKRKMIFIELKGGNWNVENLLKKLEDSKLTRNQIVIISFEPSVIQAIEVADSTYKTALLVTFKAHYDGTLSPSLPEILDWAQTIQCDAISVKAHPFLPEDFGKKVQQAGFEFHVWTVDDPLWARVMADQGARSITTNKPDVILEAFTQN